MGRLQHQVAATIYKRSLALRIAAPKNKHQMFSLLCQHLDYSICERLPSMSLVRACLMLTDGEGGVEQHHTLLCPARQVATGRHRRSSVIMDFFENILQ